MCETITVIRLPTRPQWCPVRTVMTTVARADLTLADRLHTDDGHPRPYATAWHNDGNLDVICFGDDLARALLIGESRARPVTRVPVASLVAANAGARYLWLTFTAPTHFRIAGLDHLLPDPESVFGGLLARWQALNLPDLPRTSVKRVPTEMTAYRRATWRVKQQGVTAFAGTVRYDLLPCDDAGRMTLHTLARFAQYRGVGAHTSYGMGRVVIGADGRRSVWEDERALLDGGRAGVRQAQPLATAP